LDVPLERDEGEYAYMGQLVLQGVPPYSAAYSMKLPGTDLMYAGIMSLFGQSIQGIHLGLIVLNCATIVLLFYLGRKLVNDVAAAIASGSYAVLSLSSSVFGFAAHATHFVALPAIGGALLLLSAVDKNKPHLYFFSGTLFGLAFLMKQPGLFS
jgi:4-amino-4-deoxy-L-arabinose transferase-like glycosyltransferase